jgi:DNA-binding MarR family transcriptional regulator
MDVTTEPAVRVARELRVVFGRLRRRLREVGGAGDLTPSQMSVLSRLDKDGPASASALANAERIRPQSMAATLAALDEHGLLERAPDPDDGRRQLISLTPAGRARLEDNRQAREEWLARTIRDRYSADEVRTLDAALTLLDRLSD